MNKDDELIFDIEEANVDKKRLSITQSTQNIVLHLQILVEIVNELDVITNCIAGINPPARSSCPVYKANSVREDLESAEIGIKEIVESISFQVRAIKDVI